MDIVKPIGNESLIPDGDMTDVGQGVRLARVYQHSLRYYAPIGGTGYWLVYDGVKWCANEQGARALSIELTDRQLEELENRKKLNNLRQLENQNMDNDSFESENKTINALRKEVKKRRNGSRLDAALKVAASKLAIRPDELDANPFLLNTPSDTVDLRTGEIHPHSSADFCTMATSVSPGTRGQGIWNDFLHKVTDNNTEVIECLQDVAGMALIGRVFAEKIVILVGPGGNGKTTFLDLLSRVMGDYACALDSSVLNDKGFTNKFALARICGKRLVTMGELNRDTRINRSMLLRISSSAKIQTEEKYQASFEFAPSHTAIIETNDLPLIDRNDVAVWDRVIIIPFGVRIRGTVETKYDMADYLYDNCGSAALAWAIEGAQRYINNHYRITTPDIVLDALAEYKDDCNLIVRFVRDCCVQDSSAMTPSGMFLDALKTYLGPESVYTAAAVRQQVTALGYNYKRTNKGICIQGLKLLE